MKTGQLMIRVTRLNTIKLEIDEGIPKSGIKSPVQESQPIMQNPFKEALLKYMEFESGEQMEWDL
ncbi:hypothetical protein [Paenibacillus sp. FSL P4-0288]|uniref:hypothetical protein n=1 Tax=Paenibacillus sp. FSL P4-0288 TaxID=2921633 RepID=UPI0030FA43B1